MAVAADPTVRNTFCIELVGTWPAYNAISYYFIRTPATAVSLQVENGLWALLRQNRTYGPKTNLRIDHISVALVVT